MRRIALGTLALLGMPLAQAFAQDRAGAEFRVNTYTTSLQELAAVASDGAGNFVVAWESYGQDGSHRGIVAQRYAASGAPQGSEFVVNTSTTLSQAYVSVARAPDGRFVMTWTEFSGNGEIFGQRFDASGRPTGSEFKVNTDTLGSRRHSDVSMAPSGAFVVVWESNPQDGSGRGVFGQRFDAAGARVGGEFRVNTYTTLDQRYGAVTMTPGGFVVVWTSEPGQDGSVAGVFGQRFDGSGGPVGAEFKVNTHTPYFQYSPSITSDRDGNFLVVWASSAQDGSSSGVYGQLYDTSGSPRGGEFRINAYTTSMQFPVAASAAAMEERGNFVVTWYSYGQDGSNHGVFGRRFDFNGAPRGAEFQANTYTTSIQVIPAVASDPSGNFIVAWHSADADSVGIFAQRYGGLFPAALAVDDGANDVVEVGDTFTMVTAWRNHTGASQALAGVATGHTAPPGLEMSVSPQTIYGSVPDGAVGSCQACLGVILGGARPAGHVDVSVGEFLLPQGQEKRWVMHVGESFGDVPRASGFYRFVETLLHRGVTAGCAATSYCPAGSTTREQMSVFVLVAKEGAGYLPPACATPVFADVPASSPFCRWIEELARRGVTAGCGGGNYCPADPVSREQMAVFVLRTLDAALDPPACTTPIFNDVPADSPFCRWIEELVRRGVVTGCAPQRYCPTEAVTREQMAVFLTGTFGLTLYGP